MEIFRRLMADARNDESYADAAHGYLLALLDRGMIEEVFEEMQRLSLPEEQSDDILAQALAAKALAAYDNGDYLYALRLIEASARVAPLTYDTSLLKGWAYYNMGNYEKARSTFETLDQQYSTQDTRSALELIRQRKFW